MFNYLTLLLNLFFGKEGQFVILFPGSVRHRRPTSERSFNALLSQLISDSWLALLRCFSGEAVLARSKYAESPD